MSPETLKLLDQSYQRLRDADLPNIKQCATDYARHVNIIIGIFARRIEILERKLDDHKTTG